MNKGWYPRRRGAGDHLATGRISLFDDGVHDFICMNAQSRIDPVSTTPAGVWIGSARKIWLLTARQDTERAIQRSLQKLERIGWIKRWIKLGQRGDYPILISKFVVTDLSLNRFIVNTASTIDWQHPTLEACTLPRTEVSGNRQGAVSEASPLLQELENERIGDSTPQAPKTTPSEEAIALASLLKLRILRNIPNLKVTPQQDKSWALEADRMMRCDNRTATQIREIIEWSQQDTFWQSNILSMKTLRKQFDQLTAKKNAARKGGVGHAANIDEQNLAVAGFSN